MTTTDEQAAKKARQREQALANLAKARAAKAQSKEARGAEVAEAAEAPPAPPARAGLLDLVPPPTTVTPVPSVGPVAPTGPTEGEDVPGDYPVPYYQPRVMDERFRIGDSIRPVRFYRGVFVASNATEEASVRKALAAYGRDKPDRWRGDDLNRQRSCKRCGFTTRNEAAWDDHETYYPDH